MSKDAHSITHRGGHGLFDDMDELSHAEEHELHHVQNTSRRPAYQSTKEAKKMQRIARRKPSESKLSFLFAKMLSRRNKENAGFERFEDEEEGVSKKITVVPEIKVTIAEADGYRNRDWDTGAVESPWLRECGMIRVKSNNPGGCHIVAKPFILKDN